MSSLFILISLAKLFIFIILNLLQFTHWIAKSKGKWNPAMSVWDIADGHIVQGGDVQPPPTTSDVSVRAGSLVLEAPRVYCFAKRLHIIVSCVTIFETFKLYTHSSHTFAYFWLRNHIFLIEPYKSMPLCITFHKGIKYINVLFERNRH